MAQNNQPEWGYKRERNLDARTKNVRGWLKRGRIPSPHYGFYVFKIMGF